MSSAFGSSMAESITALPGSGARVWAISSTDPKMSAVSDAMNTVERRTARAINMGSVLGSSGAVSVVRVRIRPVVAPEILHGDFVEHDAEDAIASERLDGTVDEAVGRGSRGDDEDDGVDDG